MMIGAKHPRLWLLFALWALVGTVAPGPTAAQQGSVNPVIPGRLGAETPEPPLADRGAPPRAGDNLTPAVAEPNDPPTPVVGIQVRVPAVVTPGQDLEYRIIVENRSQAVAHHVTVRDLLPKTVQFKKATPEPSVSPGENQPEYQWKLGTMPGGTRKEILLLVVPTGTGDVENTARVNFEHGQRVKTTLSKPELRVREVGPTEGAAGEVLKYQIEVTNVGTVDATEVVLTNALPEGLVDAKEGKTQLRWDLGTLKPGQTRRAEYQVTAGKSGAWSTKVQATGKDVTASASTVVTVGERKLTVIATGPAHRLANRPAVYHITVSNAGNVALNRVQVSDEIPKAMTVVSTSSGGHRNGEQVVWDLGTIPAGGRRTVQVVLRSGAGAFTNVVTARAEHDVQEKAEVETLFETPTQRRDPTDPDKKKWYNLDKATVMLEIEKGTDPVDAGGEATYTVRILNPMTQADTNLRLTIIMPPELSILDEHGPTQAKRNEQKIVFDKLPVLGPGQESAYSVKVQAGKPGVVQLKAEVTSDALPQGTVVSQEEKITILQSK